jgi:Thiamine monophosphate synthase
MKEENINIPLVAIGGIKFDDISHIMKTGVNGIAISGGILNAENPVGETARIIKEINININ